MLKKILLSFALLSAVATFCGSSARFDAPAAMAGAATLSDDLSLLREGDYVISAYDNLIRSVSEQEGHDWRLMSAIAYHESRFTPGLVSRRGARGLMQIMPSVARHFDVPADRIGDLETNVRLANWLLSEIQRSLRFPPGVSERDRLCIALASYNGGLGHVLDARSLASDYGEDPNSWEVVARYLGLKADPAYYEHETVRCGRFTGGPATVAYVDGVMGRYDRYCRMAVR